MRRHYGDVTTSGTALMSDAHGHLFSYDGRTVEQLDGPAIAPFGWGWMNRPIESERTFVDGGGRLYEIRGTRHGELALFELVPEDRSDPGWFHAVTMPNGTPAIVRRHGIYEIVADKLRPIWSPPQGQYVVGPARANRLTDGGLVVTVGDEELRTTNWHLAPCTTARDLNRG